MKKAIISLAIVAIVTFVGMNYINASDKAWFDMEKCEMCVPLMTQEGLMENMTWEHHNVSNGLMSVCTVAEGYMDKYKTAKMGMAKVHEKMMAGEKVELCNMCISMSGTIAKGLTMDNVETMHGSVMLMTSDNAELVTEIQNWGSKTNEEMQKMMAHSEEADHSGDEGK